ncbi:augmenter of liver regeneration [Cordyceps militaris]|uniref:Sulfhydryl oxidase n=1 Tax=Cordyceps militaris TaxID=73501 RepID=A0A2H4SNJ7_CORMI|nr:augmenter of liver regeneration [Cordyceps militaris]
MAEDTREDAVGAAPVGAGPPVFPKGVVLDKDGKPCRSCTSGAAFSAWAAQTKHKVKSDKTTTMATTEPAPDSRADCPPDVEILGRSSWTLLHTIAATYPDTPSRTQQADMLRFVDLFAKLYPCWVCADDFQAYMARRVPKVASRDDFGQWLCGAHNDVNRKLGKEVFDCSRWLERWKTGPKDGRCD